MLTVVKAIPQDKRDSLIKQTQIDQIKALVEEFPVGAQLSMAVLNDTDVNYLGMLKQEDDISFISNEDSVFEIGSLTKIFTATLLCNYLLNEKIEKTDKINSFLPFKIKKKMTFEQLANHTSGLQRLPANLFETVTDAGNPYANYTEEMFEDYLENHLDLKTKAGAKYSYSNLGFGLLGYVLSQIEKEDYKILVDKYILSKYNMSSSGFELDKFKEMLVDPYDANGAVCKNWDWSSTLCAAGGLKSTTHDLVKFVKAHFNANNKELRLGMAPTFVIDEKLDVGLGWHILKKATDHPVFWHNGMSGGYTSSMVIDLERKMGVIILSNQTTVSLDELVINLVKNSN